MNVKEKIKSYIKENMMNTKIEFDDQTSLYDTGILDSLKIIQLTIYLQEEFHIMINPAEITLEDFETIDNIAKMMKQLMA